MKNPAECGIFSVCCGHRFGYCDVEIGTSDIVRVECRYIFLTNRRHCGYLESGTVVIELGDYAIAAVGVV